MAKKYKSFSLVKKMKKARKDRTPRYKENLPVVIPIIAGAAALVGGAAATKYWLLEPAAKMFGGKKLGMVIPPLVGTWLLQSYVKPDATPKMKKLVNFASLSLVGAAGIIAFNDIELPFDEELPLEERKRLIAEETTRNIGYGPPGDKKLDVVVPALMPGAAGEPIFSVAYRKPSSGVLTDTIPFSIISHRDIPLGKISWRLMLKTGWLEANSYPARTFKAFFKPAIGKTNIKFAPREVKDYSYEVINTPTGRYRYRVEISNDPEFKNANAIMSTDWYNYASNSTPGVF